MKWVELFPTYDEGVYKYDGPTAFKDVDGTVFGPSFEKPIIARGFVKWLDTTHSVDLSCFYGRVDKEKRHAFAGEYLEALDGVMKLFPDLTGHDEVAEWALEMDGGHEYAIWDSLNHMLAGRWKLVTRAVREEDHTDCDMMPVVTIDGHELEQSDSLWEHFFQDILRAELAKKDPSLQLVQ